MWQIFSSFFVGFKLVKVIAYVALVGTLTATLIGTFSAALSGVAAFMPADSLLLASSLFPSNLDDCIALVISTRIARWVYDWNVKFAGKLAD